LQPAPTQQHAIQTIKRLDAKGHSLREISKQLVKHHRIDLSHMGVADVLRREQAKSKGKKGTA